MMRRLGRITREGGPVGLSEAWRAWVTENALREIPRDELLATLGANGVPAAVAARETDAILGSPLFAGARRVVARAARYELLTHLARETSRLGPSRGEIERRSGVSWDEFLERYYATGLPVVLTDTFASWPRLASWTPASLKARAGDAEVDVVMSRDSDPACDAHHAELSQIMRFGELCDRITAAGSTNDFYLIANNLAIRRPLIAALLDDIRTVHPLLDEWRDAECAFLWVGPEGTVTPLHHDTSNVLICQVFGRKRFRVYRRFEVSLTDEMRDFVYSPFDPERPDFERFPALEGVEPHDVVLSPGEALFVPIGCFHHVRALEPSINLTFTNFRAPNQFVWYFPGGVR
jgi:ribosomal protein L16 Arg81 hydroxylase